MKITFWMKAFIPSTLYSTTGEELTWRSHFLKESSGKEGISFLPLLTLFPYLMASYATDQRDFSSKKDASARITTVIDIPDHRKKDTLIRRYSDPTHQVSGVLKDYFTATGSELDSRISNPKGSQCIERADHTLHIAFSTSGCNPFFQAYGVDFAPSIAMSFDLELDFRDPTQVFVNLSGNVSQFPAFEAYLQVDEQEPVCLLRHNPQRGCTPFNLLFGKTELAARASVAILTEPKRADASRPETSSKRNFITSKL